MGAILSLLGKLGLGTLNVFFSIFSAGMNGALSLTKSAMNAALQYHQEGIEFARGMGMSLQQAQAYTTVLTDRAAELGLKYGVAADAVKELQTNLAEATGKAVMLNDVDAEEFLQMDKLVGSNVTRQFTSEIMNHLGGQLHTVEGAVSKAYATAAKSGLNAAQFSEKVAKNLSMANKLSFRNGVNGIIKMTALSEKLGFNLQSVEAAANKFMDLDSAIESSAQLQMLGGAAGAYGSNPLTMAYEANYDPEAFTERMTKTLGGYATFDVKTGMANVNGMNRDFVKGISQAMGISMDEAMSIAKKQAEIKYKESSGLNDTVRAMNLSDEQKDYLINASYVGKDGKLKMTDENGQERDISSFDAEELNKMMSLQNMSDEEIMKQQALSLISINERIAGFETSAVAELAKGVNPNLEKISQLISEFAPIIKDEIEKLAPKIGEIIREITDFISKHGDEIATGIHLIGDFLGFILDHWKAFLAAFIGIRFISWFSRFSRLFRSGSNIISRSGNAATRGTATRSARAAATKPNGLFGSMFKGLKLPKASKLFKSGGGVASVAVSSVFAGLDMNTYKETMENLQDELEKGRITQEEYNEQAREAKNQKNEALGAGVGSIIGGVAGTSLDEFIGPFGTILGAMIGDFIGGWIGRVWNSISNTISDFWNITVRDIADKTFGFIGTAYVDATSELFDGLTSGFGALLEGLFGGIGTLIGSAWDSIKTSFDGLTQIFEGDFVGGFLTIMKGQSEAMVTSLKAVWEAWTAPFLGAWEGWKGAFGALTKLLEGTAHGWSKVANWFTGDGHAEGGIIGGNSYSGDKVLARVNSGEMVLNESQQSGLFSFISNIPSMSPGLLTNSNDVKAKPVGEREYIYTPNRNNVGNGVTELTVRDINVNVNGTIKLDAGSFTKNIDINQLLNDSSFVSSLKEIIKNSINNDMNGGRFMNDNATLRGSIGTTTYWGR